jgi:hypothetical protein
MEPAAIERAKSLYRFALEQGTPPNTFVLTLTHSQATELLEWYATQYTGSNECFDLDVMIARRTQDPWPVLANFRLYGFEMAKQSELN